MTDRELYVFAATIWGEARGEPLTGKASIAHVILHRQERPRWPDTVAGVCLQPAQFSAWNPRDPNRVRIELVDLDEPSFWDCMYVAIGSIRGHLPDPTGGADHYHTIDAPNSANTWPPAWAEGMRETARIGGHVLYDSGSRAA